MTSLLDDPNERQTTVAMWLVLLSNFLFTKVVWGKLLNIGDHLALGQ